MGDAMTLVHGQPGVNHDVQVNLETRANPTCAQGVNIPDALDGSGQFS